MLSRRTCLEFSSEEEYLAFSSDDGCLKIWETSTGVLKQEYVPSSHLSSSCYSLSWGPRHRITNTAKKAKKCSSSSNLESLQLIAMGTRTGEILLYSFTNSDFHSILKNGHSRIVSSVAWCRSTHALFSCSHDQHVIVWDVVDGTVKTKWKADTGPLYALSVIDSNNVLTASSTITWWNVEEKKKVKTFSGHATEVFWLTTFLSSDKNSIGYFLSAALGDRVISVWKLDGKNETVIASLVSPDELMHIDTLLGKNETLKVSAILKDGTHALFEHSLTEKSKVPIQAKSTLHIASQREGRACSVPVLAASIGDGLDACLLTYGTFLKPTFERIDLTEVASNLFLVRDLSFSSGIVVEKSVSKIKATDTPSNVRTLAPGHMTQVSSLKESKKRKLKKKMDISELPMEDRLKALDLSHFPTEEETALKTDSMIHLLLQGLQSKDKEILNTVLFSSDPLVIRNTLERMPLNAILAFLREVKDRLTKQEQRNHPCLKWLNALLTLHLPYLMSCKDIDEYLGPISQLIEARVENFSKMLQLRGCLKVLLSKTSENVSHPIDPLASDPLVEYQSESSSEESESTDASDSDEETDQDMRKNESSASSESGMEDDS